MNELESLRRERDLLLRLLELGTVGEVDEVLSTALTLMTEVSEAKRGYIELRLPDAPADAEPRWSAVHALTPEDVGAVRALISRGIVAEALARGQTVQTASARHDPRFGERESVRRHDIHAVLCVPLGSEPPAGVLYLEGTQRGGAFTPDVRNLAEVFGRHVEPVIDRLLVQAEDDEDPTRPYRDKLDVADLIGRSPAFAAVLRQISLVAPLDVTVLITGPSGTGKTQVARATARNSPRAKRPFLDLNCAALPDELIESELFGAMPGAHSTAARRINGKVAAAEGGTLFLDEIGELSVRAQAKLLQLIQEKTYFPLGGNKPIRADVRLLAATKLDLKAQVERGLFREDLFYRLSVLPVAMPPLSARVEDIGALVRHFAKASAERMKLPPLSVAGPAIAAARAAQWPGHIRQLAHAVDAAIVRAHGDEASAVQQRHLFPEAPAPSADPSRGALPFQEATRRFQRQLVADALGATDWNVSEAARRLELTRSHLYNLIKGFDLKRG